LPFGIKAIDQHLPEGGFQDEPDPRPLPEARVIGGAVADIFDALIATLRDTRLEPDLDDLLWSTANARPSRPSSKPPSRH
jgi:hypothetical protein